MTNPAMFCVGNGCHNVGWRGGRAVGSCPHGPGRPASPDMQIIIRSGTYPLVIGSGP
jgi:hypothetical protein